MKAIRYIIFTAIIFFLIALIYTLPLLILFIDLSLDPLIYKPPLILLADLLSMNHLWTILLIFFGLFVVIASFSILFEHIEQLSAKILVSPNKNFTYYTILTISVLIGIMQVIYYWTNFDLKENEFGIFYSVMLTFLTIGVALILSAVAGKEIFEKEAYVMGVLLFGVINFLIGMYLAFCLASTKACYINPYITYTWYSGIWHGIFVIPKWVVSWFVNGIYCKAPNATTAYDIWWWISFILYGGGFVTLIPIFALFVVLVNFFRSNWWWGSRK